MIDIKLAAAVLGAIPLGALLIIVGDVNQLPSVGPGSFLRDIIAAGVPTATLTQILRSDGGGRVVRACHAIAAGEIPTPAASLSLPTENWFHYEVNTPAEIGNIILERVAAVQAGTKLGLDPVWDVQVISAQHDKPGFGCNQLNERLSSQLNRVASSPAGDSKDLQFRRGDKVIRRKNEKVDEMVAVEDGERAQWTWTNPETYQESEWSFKETAVVNGDMGIVEDIIVSDRGNWVVVRFRNPDRLCRLKLGSCHLQRAYAITAHSSQGSGYPYVIVPVHPSFFFNDRSGTGLWCRELLYTALSRAEMILITVGTFDSIPLAIRRRTLHKRRTRLATLLPEATADAVSRAAKATQVAEMEAARIEAIEAGTFLDTEQDEYEFALESVRAPINGESDLFGESMDALETEAELAESAAHDAAWNEESDNFDQSDDGFILPMIPAYPVLEMALAGDIGNGGVPATPSLGGRYGFKTLPF